jgi:hypothetical protein
MSRDGYAELEAMRSGKEFDEFLRVLGEATVHAFDDNLRGHLNPVLDIWSARATLSHAELDQRLADTLFRLIFERPRGAVHVAR